MVSTYSHAACNPRTANSVNRCAWWLDDHLDECDKPKIILYIGPLDLRYLIFVLAAAKAGHIVSFHYTI